MHATWKGNTTLTELIRSEDSLLSQLPPDASPPASSARGQALNTVLASLEDSKAEDIVPIDIAGKSSLGDFMVVASGRSHRHVNAITDHLVRDLKEAGVGPVRVEGLPHCDWVLVDAGDLIIHVFRPEVRVFYNLEKMWMAEEAAERRARA